MLIGVGGVYVVWWLEQAIASKPDLPECLTTWDDFSASYSI